MDTIDIIAATMFILYFCKYLDIIIDDAVESIDRKKHIRRINKKIKKMEIVRKKASKISKEIK